MLTEEQLSERLRAALHRELAAINPPEDLLELVRAKAAGERARRNSSSDAHRSRRRHLGSGLTLRRRLPTAGRVIALASSALVVAVVAGALVVITGHRRSASATASPPRQELLRTLGVLRTAPTASDRRLITCAMRIGSGPSSLTEACRRELVLPLFLLGAPANRSTERAYAEAGYPKLDLALIRTVAYRRWGAVVMILQSSFRPSSRSSRRSEGLVAWLTMNGFPAGGGPYPPMSNAAFRAHGLALFHPFGKRTSRGVVIVPDGVARVELGPFKLLRGEGKFDLRRIANVAAAVHDNVAWLQISTPALVAPGPTRFVVGPGTIQAAAQMTWLDADGNVIARTSAGVQLSVTYRRLQSR